VREAVREVASNIPITDIKTQGMQASETLTRERLLAKLLSLFGLLALLLASIGLYGVLAYSVGQRTAEIGIRMALGAKATNVLYLVTWQGLKLVLVGLAVGGLSTFALKRVLVNQLYGVQANDPLTFSAVAALMMIIALVACWIPARRAAHIDPMSALRNE
jgi:putative ABC transport system permease protein